MTTATTEKIIQSLAFSNDMETKGLSGLIVSANWAVIAERHMKEFRTTAAQLGVVSVKSQKNSIKNPSSLSFHGIFPEEEPIQFYPGSLEHIRVLSWKWKA